jgi:hypothetical protein
VCDKKELLVKGAAAAAAAAQVEEEEEEVQVARPTSPFAAFFGGQKVRGHGCCCACKTNTSVPVTWFRPEPSTPREGA